MLEIISCQFSDLSEDEKKDVSDNGNGKEEAGYIKIIQDGEVILLKSDAMEPEDCMFAKDLNWVHKACRRCYEIGQKEA